MWQRIRRKLKSRAGESIAETLVALLIAVLALVMLAEAMSASSGVVIKGRNKLNAYYEKNEEAGGVVKKASGGSSVGGGILITDTTGGIHPQSYDIYYYRNGEFGDRAVISYELNQ